MGATPVGAALFSAFLALVAFKFLVNRVLAVPSVTGNFTKEGSLMKRAKLMFASALETVHGLGVSGLASCLLTQGSLILRRFIRSNATSRRGIIQVLDAHAHRA